MKKINLSEKAKKVLATAKLYAVIGAAALALPACGKQANETKNEPTRIEIELTPTAEPTKTIEKEPTVTIVEPYYEISAYGSPSYSQYMKITSLKDEDAEDYRLSKTVSAGLQGFNIKCNLTVFSYLMNRTDFNYTTYYDVYLAIAKNQNLDAKTKEILRSAVRNLEKNAISLEPASENYSLTALEYNLKDLKIQFCEDRGSGWKVIFNPYTKAVIINSYTVKTEEELEEAIVLGAIGYGSIEAYAEKYGKKIRCTTNEYCYFRSISNNTTDKKIIGFGEAFEDALADIIKHRAMNQVITPESSMYYDDIVIFNIYLRLAKMQPTEYQHYGYSYLTQSLTYKDTVDDVLSYLPALDIHPRTTDDGINAGSPDRIYYSLATDTLTMFISNLINSIKENNSSDKLPEELSDVEMVKQEVRNICTPVDFKISSVNTKGKNMITLDNIREEMIDYVDRYYELQDNQKELTRN